MGQIRGTITKYLDDRGFGFITTVDINDGGSTDVFFHISEIEGHHSVQERWRVKFTPEFNKKEDGYEAKNIKIISKKQNKTNTTEKRQPWYQRSKNTETTEEAGIRGKEVMERKSSADSKDEDDQTKYDPSHHV